MVLFILLSFNFYRCYHKCAHGICLLEDGVYICDCDLGWTGDDCATDCKCHGHSMCDNGTGKCDLCLNGTSGPFCDICLIGYFGKPTDTYGNIYSYIL